METNNFHNSLESFESILSKYNIILPDNSAFNSLQFRGDHPLYGKGYVLEESFRYNQERLSFIKRLSESIERLEGVYFTPLVLEELRKGISPSFDYKKRIKRRRGDRNNLRLDLFRQVRLLCQEQRRLVTEFQEAGQIICLSNNEKDFYNSLSEEYSHFQDAYELSEIDFDLLITGGVLCQKRALTSIISNDFGILKAWKKLCLGEQINSKLFGFFLRRDSSSFQLATLPKYRRRCSKK